MRITGSSEETDKLTERLSVRLSRVLADRLRQAAAEERRGLSSTIEMACELYLRQRDDMTTAGLFRKREEKQR